jgi:hypothetical protein
MRRTRGALRHTPLLAVRIVLLLETPRTLETPTAWCSVAPVTWDVQSALLLKTQHTSEIQNAPCSVAQGIGSTHECLVSQGAANFGGPKGGV